jgi:hypothetical protein
MNKQDEFYIGWQGQAPAEIGWHACKTVGALFLLLLVLAGLLALTQRTIGRAVFEWGTVKSFTGVLQIQPYPHLLVARPGQGAGQSAFYLVAPLKFGLNSEGLTQLDGKRVNLTGTLIYRGNQTMIEARPESIQLASSQGASAEMSGKQSPIAPIVTLRGEIVDSKCYLGVMNPGQLTPHRGCAVRCISGGIPPVLLVRRQTGPPLYYLLVSSDGRPVNKQVLDMVAEPVEITAKCFNKATYGLCAQILQPIDR